MNLEKNNLNTIYTLYIHKITKSCNPSYKRKLECGQVEYNLNYNKKYGKYVKNRKIEKQIHFILY